MKKAALSQNYSRWPYIVPLHVLFQFPLALCILGTSYWCSEITRLEISFEVCHYLQPAPVSLQAGSGQL